MRNRKFISTVLIVAVVLGIVGCKNQSVTEIRKDDNEITTTNSVETQEETTENKEESTTISETTTSATTSATASSTGAFPLFQHDGTDIHTIMTAINENSRLFFINSELYLLFKLLI